MQAEVSIYSGFAGGGALIGNAIAKFSAPDLYANNGRTINVDHGEGIVQATMPRENGEAPVVVNVIALVATVVGF
jgi:hypothetical protein